jgi:hypothetical protein
MRVVDAGQQVGVGRARSVPVAAVAALCCCTIRGSDLVLTVDPNGLAILSMRTSGRKVNKDHLSRSGR